jgi:hypothetical protein
MAEEPENLTLRVLRQVDAKLDTVVDRLHDLTARVGSIEDQFIILRSEMSGLRADFVRIEHRMDRFDERLQRMSAGSI